MKKIHIIPIILSLVLVLCLNSCGTPQGPGEDIVSVILSQRNITISDFDTPAELTATVIGATEESPSIVWTTSNDKVAVYENGAVVAKGYGVCIIRASYNGATAACTVTVPSPHPELSLSVTSVTFDQIGKTSIITALDSAGLNISSEAIWSTSNEKIAVCRGGVIEAQGYGSCKITAFYKGKRVDCAVEVIDPDAPALFLSAKDIELSVGSTYTLAATAKNHSAGAIEWRTSDESVAICENGTVTAVGNGVCAIVAISDAGVTDACLVRVGAYIDPSYFSDMLNLNMPEIGQELRFVNGTNGRTVSKVMVTGCSLYAEPYNADPYLLFVKLKFTCVKIYDASGPDATSPVNFKVNMYNDYNVLCDYQGFNNGKMIVGEKMEFVFDDFGIQLSEDSFRVFNVMFEEISES